MTQYVHKRGHSNIEISYQHQKPPSSSSKINEIKQRQQTQHELQYPLEAQIVRKAVIEYGKALSNRITNNTVSILKDLIDVITNNPSKEDLDKLALLLNEEIILMQTAFSTNADDE